MDPLFTNLGPGQYTGYIKDADGNEFTTSPIVLNQPALLTASSSVTNNVISIFPVGGTVPYSYSIDGINFQVTNEFVVNENGVYTITIKDNNGCIITIDETIDISAVVITFDFIKSVVCFGASDGEFYVNAIGGITPYMYRLDNEPFGTDNYFTNVSSGIHNVEVMDAVGQIISIEVTIVELDPLTFTINAVEDEIEIIASGGMPPYQYSIDNGMNFQSSAIFMDLEAGTYNVTVLDAFACDTDTLEYLLIIESIGKDKWGQMELYPNPTNDMIYLDCNACNELPESIEIFNDLGQKVDEYEWNKLSKIELNVQSLSAGHYIIVVKGADKLARYKVLKF